MNSVAAIVLSPPSLTTVSAELDTLRAATDAQETVIDDYDRQRIAGWLQRCMIWAEEQKDAQAVVDKACLLLPKFLTRFSRPTQVARRSFQFLYHSPLSKASETFTIDIEDDARSTEIGSQTWSAAPLFARSICQTPTRYFSPLLHMPSKFSTRPFRVLELGSGTGLVGITIALALDRLLSETSTATTYSSIQVELYLTDYHPTVLASLQRNVDLNMSNLTRCPSLAVSVECLDWTDLTASKVDGSFDLIFGSDLVYEVNHAEWSANAVKHYLRPHADSFAEVFSSPSSYRGPTPDPSCEPAFWLMLPLRPTFEKESAAVHDAYGSSTSAAWNVGDSGERKWPVKNNADGDLVICTCMQMEGIAHGVGHGSRSYQLLQIKWHRNM